MTEPTDTTPAPDSRPRRGVSRRTLFTVSGAAAVVGAANGAAGVAALRRPGSATASDPAATARLAAADAVVQPGELPVGLAAPAPAFGHLLAFDLTPAARATDATARRAAIAFLRTVSGLATGSDPDAQGVSGRDLTPANLQITPGIGASLLDACGLAARRPAAFVELPAFGSDRLRPQWSGGDVMVQVAAEDPMRLAGAVQQLVAAAGGDVSLRWERSGFKATTAASRPDAGAPRNLMGHHDGTANPPLGSALWDFTVRARTEDWMRNGSYLVARRIDIDLSRWYTEPVAERDRVIGRATATGAPLGGRVESDPSDLSLRDAAGDLVIPARAHLRLAHASNTQGARIYRRPWNYDDGFDAAGRRLAGLLFLAWQADPTRGFIPIQQALDAGSDALSDYISHVGSALFAVPAQGTDAYVGQRLLEG